MAYYYKNKGYKVRQEVPIGHGKSNPIDNVKKCADYHQVICIATSPTVEKQIIEKLAKKNLANSMVSIVECKGFY